MQPAFIVVLWPLSVIVALFIGGFLKSYMAKKGENLATHEDIDKLVEQVSAVTKATKEIEARISGDVWDRQKRWDMKREVLFEAARRVSDFDNALVAYASVLRTQKIHEQSWNEAFTENGKYCNSASKALDEAKLLVAIVCSKETRDALDEFDSIACRVVAGVGRKDADIYDKSQEELARKFLAVRAAIRKELGIDKPA